MPKRLRSCDIAMPDRKKPKTMEISNRLFSLPDDLIEHIFSFIKRPRITMDYSENVLMKIYKE